MFNVILKLDYIPSPENDITDAISRNNWTEARKRIDEKGWNFSRKNLSAYMKEWEEVLLALYSVHKHWTTSAKIHRAPELPRHTSRT